jgi:hypothetical protein
VLGAGWQLQQSALWPGFVYAGALLLGIAALSLAHRRIGRMVWPLLLVAGALRAGDFAGVRATLYSAQALPSALHWKDATSRSPAASPCCHKSRRWGSGSSWRWIQSCSIGRP